MNKMAAIVMQSSGLLTPGIAPFPKHHLANGNTLNYEIILYKSIKSF